MIPRIRGKVGQATEPPEYEGKWFFELWLSEMGGGEGLSLGQFGPFETESLAHDELKRAARMTCEEIERGLIGEVSGKYLDMKTNQTVDWENA